MRLSLAILLLVISAQAQVRYHFGSDPKWAEPGFDDSAWPAITDKFPLPLANSDGMVWLRYRVPVPPDRSPLAIFLDRSGGACSPGELWVNGVRVGSQGRFPPDPLTTDHCGPGVFDLRDGIVEPGGTAVVALRSWIAPLLRGALFYHPPVLPRPEIGSGGFMRAREKNTFDSGMRSFLIDGFLVLLELGIGLGVLFIWWRARAGASLLWFSLFVLSWGALEVAWFWPPNRHNLQSSELYWFWQCAFSVVVNTAVFEFMGRVFDVPRWATRTLEIAGIVWPVLWFPSAFLVEPFPIITALGLFGSMLFGFQSVGQTVLALWAAARGRKETRGLAAALFFAGAVYLLSDFLMVVPLYVRVSDMNVSTDNAATFLVIGAMCYLLLRRLWLDWRRKEDLDAEFEAAREMQARLVPAAVGVAGFEIESAYHPARQVGGDFFRMLPVEDGSVLMVVGDVSGKGLGAAMTVAAIAGALDNEFSRRPAEVLEHLNRALLMRKSGGFVTCCAALLKPSGEVVIANAGHLAPYVDGSEMEVEGGLPLGITPDADYSETTTTGTRFTFISDGVLEAANAANELFGFERSREISGKSAGEIAEAAKAWGQNDDITVVTVRRNG